MAVTIIKGLPKAYAPDQNQQNQIKPSDSRHLAEEAQRLVATGSLGQEAVVTSLRNSVKASDRAEKLGSYKEAKQLSEEVADELTESTSDEPLSTHKVSAKGGYYA